MGRRSVKWAWPKLRAWLRDWECPMGGAGPSSGRGRSSGRGYRLGEHSLVGVTSGGVANGRSRGEVGVATKAERSLVVETERGRVRGMGVANREPRLPRGRGQRRGRGYQRGALIGGRVL